ncbi:hypothetical protein B0H12DRAFT_365407 [Mycena haematopus]|nr:hypothetical protein B0H12DRAFT_365407 [Mycena haematopus]
MRLETAPQKTENAHTFCGASAAASRELTLTRQTRTPSGSGVEPIPGPVRVIPVGITRAVVVADACAGARLLQESHVSQPAEGTIDIWVRDCAEAQRSVRKRKEKNKKRKRRKKDALSRVERHISYERLRARVVSVSRSVCRDRRGGAHVLIRICGRNRLGSWFCRGLSEQKRRRKAKKEKGRGKGKKRKGRKTHSWSESTI